VRVEQLASGLGWPEGPCAMGDGSLAFVEPYRGQLSVWRPGHGVASLAHTAGSPNSSVLAKDGSFYVCQDGDQAEEPVPPSIQRVSEDQRCDILALRVEGLRLTGPNDLTFGADARLYFTDPGRFDPARKPDPGYIFALDSTGLGQVVADLGNDAFPNGIAADDDQSIVWAESYTGLLRRWRPQSNSIENITRLPDLKGVQAVPDGLALAANGDIYVTAVNHGGIHVVSRSGAHKGFLAVGTRPTNCAFSNGWLYVTDAGAELDDEANRFGGSLWRLRLDMDGLEVHSGLISAATESAKRAVVDSDGAIT
jgi:gluconolactonase